MNKTERNLFRQALTEAFVRKYERELAECQETAQCSEAHIQRMHEIISRSARAERRKDRRKWVVALLVAAALLLTACTVYAYHEEIRGFIEKVYQSHIKVTYDEETDAPSVDAILNDYTLGYVPEEYVLVEELYLPFVNKCKWRNSEGEHLYFEQCVLDSTNFSLDVETGETTVITCGEFNVYYRVTEIHSYIWNNGVYSFKVASSCPLSKDTLDNIINSLRIRK